VSDPRLCVVSGISGAGRTTVVKALEDLGYFCVDNLPVALLEQLVELFRGREQLLAVVIDVREREFLPAVPAALDALRARGVLTDLLFLNASDEALAQRFNETRRLHPTGPGQGLAAAIARERELLAPLADRADLQLDTTRMTVHELRAFVTRRFGPEARASGLQVELVSFGFRYGLPDLADLLFDVRFLQNPHFVPELRERTGLDTEVAEFVLQNSRTRAFLERLRDFLDFLLPLYEEEGKSYLTIAVGCTGGQHRSIAVVGALERTLRERKIDVRVLHRDAWRFEPGAQRSGRAGS
jgi:RNase adapter protein RapZ